MGNTKSNVEPPLPPRLPEATTISDVKRLLNGLGYSASELEIQTIIKEVGNNPKKVAEIISFRRKKQRERLLLNRNSSNTVAFDATSAIPKRKWSLAVSKSEAFPYKEEQSNMRTKTTGGGGNSVLTEAAQTKRSRVKFYDTKVPVGKGDVCNLPQVSSQHITASLSSMPKASVPQLGDVWRDTRTIDLSRVDDKVIDKTIEGLQSKLEGTSKMEREEFSFPSSWPAAATAAPPVLRTLSPPLRTTADVEQSESETVDEVENSDQDVNESTHFTRILGKLRRRLSGLQQSLEEESRKWQGSDAKERVQAAFRVLQHVKLTGFTELSESTKQNLIDATDLLLERLSSSYLYPTTSDSNSVMPVPAAAQIILAAITIKEVRMSIEKIYMGIIHEFTEKVRQKPSSGSQETENTTIMMLAKYTSEPSWRKQNAVASGVIKRDDSSTPQRQQEHQQSTSSSLKRSLMETTMSKFQEDMKQVNDIVSTMEQYRTELSWLQTSNTESVDMIRSTLSKLSETTSELRSLVKKRCTTLEEKQIEKDVTHSELQQLIPSLQDFSIALDAVQNGDENIQKVFERRKLAMLEVKKAEDALNTAQADYITHSSTVAMCVAMVEGLNESFSKFMKNQLEIVQQTLSDGDKLILLALESVKRSSQEVLDVTNQCTLFALKSMKDRKVELKLHTTLFGSTSPENETRLKTLVYEMEKAHASSISKSTGIVRDLLALRERLNLLITAKSIERVDIIGREILNGKAGRKALTEYRRVLKDTEVDLSQKCNLQ